uniref:Uncharacterized protein n=1 Tax=Pyrodinium bahamense TaxID=73915 RepID=A0A7S0FBD4_9DINO|mmetsp:Transcript_19650/g.54013  ORF Transcript_19650/g.54013 Transcript_19650/m.54013 type:complete len:175 (+) Transcript_19650:2-526(+)
MYHVTKDALSSVYYFNDPEAPPSFTMDVAASLVPKFFARGESLDCLRHCLCVMERGTVAHGGLILVPPNVFHEDFIISQKKYQKIINTISLTYTQVLVLTREDMEAILAPHPQFERKIRRYAVKMAFCRAVRMTMTALERKDRSMVAASRMRASLSQAFDGTCGEEQPRTWRAW